jgi:hypothetical protein
LQSVALLTKVVPPAIGGGLSLLLGIAAAVMGIQFLPPSYNLPDTRPPGAVEVYVSDPDVRVFLNVIVFDVDWDFPALPAAPTTDEPSPSPKMILQIEGDEDKVIDWAVVFTGAARLPERSQPSEGPTELDGMLLGATTRVMGDMQIVEGKATVGPKAWTTRQMDWFDESVGPFFFRSGAWPSYGSKTATVLPAYGGMEHFANAEFDRGLRLGEPANLEVTVGLMIEPPGDFLRVDGTEPHTDPIEAGTTDPTRLQWTGSAFPEGIRVLYTDVASEADESSRAVVAGVLLGLAGSALLSAVGQFVVVISAVLASRRQRVDVLG